MGFWVRFNSKNPSKSGLLKRGEVVLKSGALLERIRYLKKNKTNVLADPIYLAYSMVRRNRFEAIEV